MLKKIMFCFVALIMQVASTFADDGVQGIPLIDTKFSNDDLETLMTDATVQTLEDLKKQNFDFNTKDTFGNPALFYLLTKNPDLNVARKAIEFGADVNAPAGNGMIPLNISTSKANELQLQILMMKTLGLDVSNPEVQEALKANLFHEMNKMIEMAQMLIDNGADVNKESSLGTPIVNAVTNAWNREIVEMLIKAGANLNWKDKEGRTPLFYAAASGNGEIITLLIKAGADTDVKDNGGKVYLDVEKVGVDNVL